MGNRLSGDEFLALAQRVRDVGLLTHPEAVALLEEAEGLSDDLRRALSPQPCIMCEFGHMRPVSLMAIDLEMATVEARLALADRDDIRILDALTRMGRPIMELRGYCLECARRAIR